MVKMHTMTQEEFYKRQMRRNYYLSRKGWKQIRIISLKDFLPQDEVVIEMINSAMKYLNSGRHWIEYYIDEGQLICSQYKTNYNYGQLRKI